MELDDCIIVGAKPVDSSSINHCFMNLFEYAKEKSSSFIDDSSDNIPVSAFYKDGYGSYPLCGTDGCHPSMTKYHLLSSDANNFGLVERMYDGAVNIDQYAEDNTHTESTSGDYQYTTSYIKGRFVPSVNTLYSTSYPIIFASLLGDESAVECVNGTASIDSTYAPSVKYTSYLLCSGIGVSFGTIEFSDDNGTAQRNSIVVDVVKDLVHMDNVDSIKFVTIGNGVASGVRAISEDLDLVNELCSANLTFLDSRHSKIALTNITKNDASDTIRIDKSSGRILEDGETAERGSYNEISNDGYSLSFFVVFTYSLPDIMFTNESIALGETASEGNNNEREDYSNFMYGRTELYGVPLTLSELVYMDNRDYTPRPVNNTVVDISNAFANCTLAEFGKVSHFSSNILYAQGCFDGCTNSDFTSLAELTLPLAINTSKMFNGCSNSTFNALGSISIPSTTDASEMFSGCTKATFSSLQSIVAHGSLKSMFKNCTVAEFQSLNTIIGNITTFDSMFYGCSNAKFPALQSITSTSKSTVTFNGVFSGCKLATFGSLNGINTIVPFDGSNMFSDCSVATFDMLNSAGDVEKADGMFKGCANAEFPHLTSISKGNLTTAIGMFSGCTKANISLSAVDGINTLGKLANASECFKDCLSVSIDDKTVLSALVNAESMFSGCDSVSISSDIGSSIVNADSMFKDCGSVTISAAFNGNDSSNSVSYASAFENVGALSSMEVDADFIETIGNADRMFYGCNVLGFENVGDRASLNFTKLYDGDFMFYGCSGLPFNSLQSLSITVPQYATETSYNAMFCGISSSNAFSSLYSISIVSEKSANLNLSSMFASNGASQDSMMMLSSVTVCSNGYVDMRDMFKGNNKIFKGLGDVKPSVKCIGTDGSPRTGLASGMFSSCSSMTFAPSALFLPYAKSSDTVSSCYYGMFDGIKTTAINLSSLTTGTTNIHKLDNGQGQTNGSKLFSGMPDWPRPMLTQVEEKIGLKYAIASQMIWMTKGVWDDAYKILTRTELQRDSDIEYGNYTTPATYGSAVKFSGNGYQNIVSMYFVGDGQTFSMPVSLISGSGSGATLTCTLYSVNSSGQKTYVTSSSCTLYYTSVFHRDWTPWGPHDYWTTSSLTTGTISLGRVTNGQTYYVTISCTDGGYGTYGIVTAYRS